MKNMLDTFTAVNLVDRNGNPSGGSVHGMGLTIEWQNGPLGRPPERMEPNGAFVETVLAAALQRIQFYQQASEGKFACAENARAVTYIQYALDELNIRTKYMEARSVEGSHQK